MSSVDTIFIMGVSGCGKSTIGSSLASKLGWQFQDGDSFHPPANIEKMSSGIALTDADRLPWLETINAFARTNRRHVIACSSLKKSYREVLSGGGLSATFFLLNVERQVAHSLDVNFTALFTIFFSCCRKILATRLSSRPGHFMSPTLLDSQLVTLEMPKSDENNVIVVDANVFDVDHITNDILKELSREKIH
uniref:Gluconokinase n=1 Tax=Caenorhabditis japonica TaxID=281687 RepID=A0A8R1DU16_CAEJA